MFFARKPSPDRTNLTARGLVALIAVLLAFSEGDARGDLFGWLRWKRQAELIQCLGTGLAEIPPEERPIAREQCGIANCWLNATVAGYDVAVQKGTGQRLSLSMPYLYLDFVRAKALGYVALFEKGPSMKDIELEGEEIGLEYVTSAMPEGSFEPRIPYDQWHKMVPELKDAITWFRANWKDSDASEKAKARIHEILERYGGKPPTYFTYEGRRYTPERFKRWVERQVLRKSVIVNAQTRRSAKKFKPSEFVDSSSKINSEVATAQDMVPAIEYAFKKGIPMIFSLKRIIELIDRPNGIAVAEGRSQRQLDRLKGEKVLHAMLLIGIVRNAEGNIVGFKFQNSWGPQSGNSTMTIDFVYFKNFLTSVDFLVPNPTPTQ